MIASVIGTRTEIVVPAPGREVMEKPVAIDARTPYDTLAPDGTRYVSYADWLCPTHCVEPATCPVIRAPRN